MADRYQEYNEIERMIRCIEQAEDNLKEYEALKNALLPQKADGIKLFLCRFNHLGGIGLIAVTATVDLIIQLFFQLRFNNAHRSH